MSIDKAISYEEVERNGDKVKRKKIAYKPNAVSNGYDHYPNVIPIGEIPHEKPWYEDEARSKAQKRYASWDPTIDPMIEALQYWDEKWKEHPQGHRFSTLKDFISFITATEDWDNFRRGGLVSLII